MSEFLNQLVNRKNVFLIDGLGALTTFIMLFFLITNLEQLTGIPKGTVINLTLPVICLVAFSFFCHIKQSENWKRQLIIISVANILYCLITFSILFYYSHSLKTLGLIYFIGEIIIILFLVKVELQLVLSN